ncbi:S-layer homology domain-containing protein, partial [Paenibacillus sp. IB182496]
PGDGDDGTPDGPGPGDGDDGTPDGPGPGDGNDGTPDGPGPGDGNDGTPDGPEPGDGDDGTPDGPEPGDGDDGTPDDPDSDGGDPDGAPGSGATDEDSHDQEAASIDLFVNGKAAWKGAAVAMEVDGQHVIVVTVDSDGLRERLEQEGNGALLTIPMEGEADVVIGELDGRMVKAMVQQQAVLEVRTEDASYTIPAQQIDIDAVRAQLGPDAALQDVKVRIEISSPAADEAKRAAEAADREAIAIVVPPLRFTITGTYQGRTVEVSGFDAYVERRMALPESVDPERISTGVVIEPDGSLRHVPTRVDVINGRDYAVMESLTNSLYAVIWHPVRFADVAGHWAEEAVHDMGSRLVVNGMQGGLYRPDVAITRAEFAAILVRGLGLATADGASPFTDVQPGAWYSDAVNTAYAHGLVDGYGNGRFHPDATITREQAMGMIANTMGMADLAQRMPGGAPEPGLQAFDDAGDASAWAVPAIEKTIRAGLITGRTEHLLAPKQPITRAEAAVIVGRLLTRAGLI